MASTAKSTLSVGGHSARPRPSPPSTSAGGNSRFGEFVISVNLARFARVFALNSVLEDVSVSPKWQARLLGRVRCYSSRFDPLPSGAMKAFGIPGSSNFTQEGFLACASRKNTILDRLHRDGRRRS